MSAPHVLSLPAMSRTSQRLEDLIQRRVKQWIAEQREQRHALADVLGNETRAREIGSRCRALGKRGRPMSLNGLTTRCRRSISLVDRPFFEVRLDGWSPWKWTLTLGWVDLHKTLGLSGRTR